MDIKIFLTWGISLLISFKIVVGFFRAIPFLLNVSFENVSAKTANNQFHHC
jgi:hypothetical protein